MKRALRIFSKALGYILLGIFTYALVNSSLDIYNNFVYDKAVLRYTPYGYVPLLEDPNNYRVSSAEVKGGDFVYVENWESADNGKVVFARVKSKLHTGYVNRRMLVEANLNVMPVVSVLMLGFMFFYAAKKLYKKLNIS
jgi:hypothetical protein